MPMPSGTLIGRIAQTIKNEIDVWSETLQKKLITYEQTTSRSILKKPVLNGRGCWVANSNAVTSDSKPIRIG